MYFYIAGTLQYQMEWRLEFLLWNIEHKDIKFEKLIPETKQNKKTVISLQISPKHLIRKHAVSKENYFGIEYVILWTIWYHLHYLKHVKTPMEKLYC